MIWIKKENEGKEKKGGRGRGERRWVWTLENREEFRGTLGDLRMRGGEVGEIWKETKKRMKEILEESSRAMEERMKRGWWDV